RDISITSDIIVGFPGETEAEFEETASLLDAVGYDGIFSFKYSARPNTPALQYADTIPDEEKSRRLAVLNERQREIQRALYAKHLGETMEVMVEGYNPARQQVIGRTSQNKTFNFTVPEGRPQPAIGQFVNARVTRTYPNSLVGELVVS
ncbi:MAG TPA: TRAM domain-containing protein, partial [Clostridia bacterium]|nr:TRAM domain-containing protein [Clostridia bacterium]